MRGEQTAKSKAKVLRCKEHITKYHLLLLFNVGVEHCSARSNDDPVASMNYSGVDRD